MTFFRIHPSTTSASRGLVVSISGQTFAHNVPPAQLPHDVPFSIPQSQVYFWSSAWQRGEMASLAAIANGDVMRFEHADDAIRWLLSADE